MGNVLCIVGSKIDDFVSYGYKYLGKRNGQKVYRRVVENPIVRGFELRGGYPDTFKLTEFAFVDDAGKVVEQAARRVGTFGDATNAARKNVAQYTKYNKDFKPIKLHDVEAMPKPQNSIDSLFRVNEQTISDGLFNHTLFSVNKDGTITHAMRKTSTANPLGTTQLKGEYNYSNWAGNKSAKYSQDVSHIPTTKYTSELTVEKASKELSDVADLPKFQWTLESLRNPNFYKNLTGPGEVKTYSQMHWS